MTRDTPAIDLTRIPFPSDRISLGALRQLHPELFDTMDEGLEGLFFEADNGSGKLASLVLREREYARFVFSEAVRGLAWEDQHPRDGFTGGMKQVNSESMTDAYQAYGLASGPHEARELVRSIESAVRIQARNQLRGR